MWVVLKDPANPRNNLVTWRISRGSELKPQTAWFCVERSARVGSDDEVWRVYDHRHGDGIGTFNYTGSDSPRGEYASLSDAREAVEAFVEDVLLRGLRPYSSWRSVVAKEDGDDS